MHAIEFFTVFFVLTNASSVKSMVTESFFFSFCAFCLSFYSHFNRNIFSVCARAYKFFSCFKWAQFLFQINSRKLKCIEWKKCTLKKNIYTQTRARKKKQSKCISVSMRLWKTKAHFSLEHVFHAFKITHREKKGSQKKMISIGNTNNNTL